MAIFRYQLRRSAGMLAVCAWLLLIGDLCVDVGGERAGAEIAPAEAQGAGHSHGDHAAVHAECASDQSWSVARNPGDARVVPDALPGQVTAVQQGLSLPRCSGSVSRSSSAAAARSAPRLFLLHSAFLI